MKEIFASVGSLAMWWVIGYGIQAAAWVLEKTEPEEAAPQPAGSAQPGKPRLVA